jgi:glucose-6-phosphate isomerase
MDALELKTFPRCDQVSAWQKLKQLHQNKTSFDLRTAFKTDPGRYERLSWQAPELFIDLSKNWLDDETLAMLIQLAEQCQLAQQRETLFDGTALNLTEGRAVLHTALRAPAGQAPFSAQVQQALQDMLTFAESIRDTPRSGIRHVVNIGIGGSDLGAQMVVAALSQGMQPLQCHFVSNVDAHEIQSVLQRLRPEEVLFIVSSKTFTTQETMTNAHLARQWFIEQGGQDVANHFVAATTNVEAAADFGITKTFGFWDWVGGRFSLWSTIGLPIALALGAAAFRALLDGAHQMDRHFRETPLERNVPVLLGLLDLWYRNFYHCSSRCVAPYYQGLRRLPAYLQQLEMESNGKSVDRQGQSLSYATSPVVWGEPGTNGQHAYFQMLHQGTDVIPVEFILVKQPQHPFQDSHEKLLANGLAQSAALMLGKTLEQALQEKPPTASTVFNLEMLAQHRRFPGNRPSTTFLLDELTPRSLGALVALYEHRIFVSGALWGINSFDQWGVELGKALCSEVLPRLRSKQLDGLDASTAGLIRRLTQQ